MTDVKVSLSIILPGSVMYSQEESLKALQKPVRNKKGKVLKKKGEPVLQTVLVPDFAKNDSFTIKLEEGKEVEEVTVFVRKNRPAKQVINLTEEAYEYMISKNEPYGYQGKTMWSALNRNQRIKWHCQRIAESLGGTFEAFKVLD